MLERDAQRMRAIQVGMLMRAYRESSPSGDGGRGLTQDELLRRMASVDSDYAQRYSHTTVSRWESGVTRPTSERLEVFGKALNLSSAEVDGLMALAGFARDSDPVDAIPTVGDAYVLADSPASDSGVPAEPGLDRPADSPNDGLFQRIPQAVRQGIVTFALPGLVIIGMPFLLASFGWNQMWMPIAYIGTVLGVRLAAGYLKLSPPHDLCEFMNVSLFVLLTTPLLQSALLHMDHYGFYAIGDFAGTPTPYMLALLVNLFISTMAGGLFFVLWRAHFTGPHAASSPIRRALMVVMPPMVLAFATVVVMTNVGMWTQLGFVLAVLTAVCIVLLVLRDPAVTPNDRDRRFMLLSTLVVGTIMTVAGMAVVITVYLVPHIPSILPDHNLLFSWDIDYDRLGYPAAEALHRFNIGYLWHAMAVFVYMVFVVGGSLIGAIYRWHSDHPSGQTAVGGNFDNGRSPEPQ